MTGQVEVVVVRRSNLVVNTGTGSYIPRAVRLVRSIGKHSDMVAFRTDDEDDLRLVLGDSGACSCASD